MDKPKINQYTCKVCRKSIVTVDRDHGTTPMMLACRATKDCNGSMISAMYRVDPALKPEYEWFKPTRKPRRELREHVNLGGLLLRKIK